MPNVGEHIVTVDLQGPKSRETLIGMRLLLTEGGQDNTIMSTPAKLYPSGSITIAVNLKELGQYNLLLEPEKAGKKSSAVTLPIHVGEGGGHGGHNGLRSIHAHLPTADYVRVKIGIGRPPHGDITPWVLGKACEDDRADEARIFAALMNELGALLSGQTDTAANRIYLALNSGKG